MLPVVNWPRLERLNLSANFIVGRGVRILARAGAAHFPALRKLKLSGNASLGDMAAHAPALRSAWPGIILFVRFPAVRFPAVYP